MNLFRNKDNNVGLFIIHGYLSTPEISYPGLKELLDKNKIKNYYFPVVQGHGDDVDLNTFDYVKALSDIETEYVNFKENYDKIYIIGFSMGGALAFYLSKVYGCDKLVLLAPALKYGGDNRLASKVSDFFKSLKDGEEIKNIVNEMINETVGNTEINEKFLNIKPSVFINFAMLVNAIRKDTKNIKLNIPSRLYISEHDNLVPIEGPMYAFDRLINTDKQFKIYSGVKHRLLYSDLREEILEDVLKFLYRKKRIKWPKD